MFGGPLAMSKTCPLTTMLRNGAGQKGLATATHWIAEQCVVKPFRKSELPPPPVLLFSKLNQMFLGYFHPENIFLDNVNKSFLG